MWSRRPREIARIRRAIAITEEVFDRAFAALRPGARDRDVSESIAGAFEHAGFEGYALVQFGALSSLPHGSPQGARLGSEDAVLIDGGCKVDGYWSDITRTRWSGGAPAAEFTRIVGVVREAQGAAIARARPGIEAQEIDRAARRGDHEGGLRTELHPPPGARSRHGRARAHLHGGRQPHAAGRGLRLHGRAGVYLPGRFGVRTEDDVVCTAQGATILAGA